MTGNEAEWVAFFEWAMPRLGLRWRGFRNVHKQVRKRVARRMKEIGATTLVAYRHQLDAHPDEWRALEAACRVTISRFYRDTPVFEALERELLPELARRALDDDGALRCWSAGCASGEEPYSVALVWRLRVQPAFARVRLRVVATDTDPEVLERARAATYPAASLSELPRELVATAFERSGDHGYVVRPELRADVELRRQDLRREQPDETFHLVLCRNLAFTYFDPSLQREVLDRIAARTVRGGFLIVGRGESLPPGAPGWEPHGDCVYRKTEDGSARESNPPSAAERRPISFED